MTKTRWLALVRPLGLVAIAAALTLTPVSAQDVRVRTECRCVDRDGNRVEQCSCVRAPTPPTAPSPFADAFVPSPNRARLGISVDGRQSARNDARGARLTDIMSDGPAERAGLEVGDIVTSVAGHSLFDVIPGDAEALFDLDDSIPVQRLLALIGDIEPGDDVEVEYVRDGETHSTTLRAEDLSNQWGMASTSGLSWFNEAMGARGDNRFEFRWDQEGLEEQMRALEERLAESGGRIRFRSGDGEFHVFGEDGNITLRGDGEVSVIDEDGNITLRGGDGEVHVLGGNMRLRSSPGNVRVFGGGPAAERLLEGRAMSFFGGSLGGIELLELNPELGEYFGADAGVLVTEVSDDSSLGLEAGDVILRIGDRDTNGPDRVRRILGSYSADEEITFHVLRDRDEITVQGRLGG